MKMDKKCQQDYILSYLIKGTNFLSYVNYRAIPIQKLIKRRKKMSAKILKNVARQKF